MNLLDENQYLNIVCLAQVEASPPYGTVKVRSVVPPLIISRDQSDITHHSHSLNSQLERLRIPETFEAWKRAVLFRGRPCYQSARHIWS